MRARDVVPVGAQQGCSPGRLQVLRDHFCAHGARAGLGPPAEFVSGARGIAEQGLDLGGPEVARVDDHDAVAGLDRGGHVARHRLHDAALVEPRAFEAQRDAEIRRGPADEVADRMLFAGGDGTARNICAAVADNTTVLGIPACVKIHSGVYAISPLAAGKLVAKLVAGELVSLSEAPVMDIDEQAFRSGVVKARRFGEMRIPALLRYVQSVKMGGRESEELVLADLAAYVASQLEDNVRYVMGSGSTVAAVMAELGLDNTLLGVDVVENGELIGKDVSAAQLLELVQDYPSKLIITLIGGQGHVFGPSGKIGASLVRIHQVGDQTVPGGNAKMSHSKVRYRAGDQEPGAHLGK